jgi:hypothetical protein
VGLTWIDVGVLVLVLVTGGAVGVFALLVWRNGYIRGWRAAREVPPTCPACHYNLSGLTTCRCPECGATYSLEQLWRAPVRRRRDDVVHEPVASPATPR